MDPIALRAFERILATLIGGLAIYLGYRLFVQVPSERDGEGHIQLPGDISIFLTRVGPGVFFALFGAIVVGASFYFAVTIQSPGGTEMYSGLGAPPGASGADGSVEERGEVQYQIALLNEARPVLHDAFGEARRAEVDHHLGAIKLRLMEGVWGADWGDLTTFGAWVTAGVGPPDAVEFQRARLFYEVGEGRAP